MVSGLWWGRAATELGVEGTLSSARPPLRDQTVAAAEQEAKGRCQCCGMNPATQETLLWLCLTAAGRRTTVGRDGVIWGAPCHGVSEHKLKPRESSQSWTSSDLYPPGQSCPDPWLRAPKLIHCCVPPPQSGTSSQAVPIPGSSTGPTSTPGVQGLILP